MKTFKFKHKVSKQKEEEYNFLLYLGNVQIDANSSLLNQFLNKLWFICFVVCVLLLILIIGVYK